MRIVGVIERVKEKLGRDVEFDNRFHQVYKSLNLIDRAVSLDKELANMDPPRQLLAPEVAGRLEDWRQENDLALRGIWGTYSWSYRHESGTRPDYDKLAQVEAIAQQGLDCFNPVED